MEAIVSGEGAGFARSLRHDPVHDFVDVCVGDAFVCLPARWWIETTDAQRAVTFSQVESAARAGVSGPIWIIEKHDGPDVTYRWEPVPVPETLGIAFDADVLDEEAFEHHLADTIAATNRTHLLDITRADVRVERMRDARARTNRVEVTVPCERVGGVLRVRR